MVAAVFKILLFVACAAVASSASEVRPCPDNDNACVGQFLSNYSSCSLDDIPTDQTTLDPYYLDYFFFATPYFNVSEERTNITIDGASQSYVQDLYYNTTSGKAVLTIYCPLIRFTGTSTILKYVTGEEGFKFTTRYEVTFTNITLTTIFNDYAALELTDSYTFTTIPHPPTYDNGNTDLAAAALIEPRVTPIVEAWDTYPMVATFEAFVYRGPALVRLIADYLLCNYDAVL